jgi:hypothetical protein
VKKKLLCNVCGEPAIKALQTKIKNADVEEKLGACSRYHQLLVRSWLDKHAYSYNEEGWYEK